MCKRNGRGFTLIELLVVIAVIALLVGLLLPVLAMARKSARNTATNATIHNLNVALDNYRLDWRQYPIQPGLSNIIYDNGSGAFNPGYFQTPCEAKGNKASGVENNKDLVQLLLDQKFLDMKKANIASGQLIDYFSTPIIVRFLISRPSTGDQKLAEKAYIWSYGADTKNGVEATSPNYTPNLGLPDYDKIEIGKVEASPGGGEDDLSNWR